MTLRSTFTLRLAAALMLVSGLAVAQDPDGPAPAKKKPAAAAPKAARKPKASRQKGLPVDKRMDLNTATKAQLMTLPGVTEDYATKIIAARPYKVSSKLALEKIIPMGVWLDIDKLVTARAPKEAAKK